MLSMILPLIPKKIDTLREAVKSSNQAIVILSCGFLKNIWCMEELDLCLTEQLTDPLFKVVMILTEDENTLLNIISDEKSQSSGLFARIASHLRTYTYL